MLEYDQDSKFQILFKAIKWVFITIALLVLMFLAIQQLLPTWHWEHRPLHVSLQAVGAFMTLSLAVLMVILKELKVTEPIQLWIGCALLAIGSLDGLHAIMFTADNFVWLQSITHGVGGLLFALIWLPERIFYRACQTNIVFVTVMLIGTGIGLLLLSFPSLVHIESQFSLINGLNLIGVIGFFLATWRFSLLHHSTPVSHLLFASHSFLLGLATGLFLLAQLWSLWDIIWGFWHLLRLSAYFILLYYFMFVLKKQLLQFMKNQQRLQLLFEFAPVGIFYTDKYGRHSGMNKKGVEIMGQTVEEVIGKGWIKTVHSDDRKKIITEWHNAIENNKIFQAQLRFQRADDSIIWAKVRVMAEYSASGEIIGYVGTLTDISEMKQMELDLNWYHRKFEEIVVQRTRQLTIMNQQLQQEIDEHYKNKILIQTRETQWIAILNAIPETLIAINEHHHIIFFNQAAEYVFGYMADEVVGIPLERLLPERLKSGHRQPISDFMNEMITNHNLTKEKGIMGRHKNGNEFLLEGSMGQICHEDFCLFIAMLRIVSTEIKAL